MTEATAVETTEEFRWRRMKERRSDRLERMRTAVHLRKVELLHALGLWWESIESSSTLEEADAALLIQRAEVLAEAMGWLSTTSRHEEPASNWGRR